MAEDPGFTASNMNASLVPDKEPQIPIPQPTLWRILVQPLEIEQHVGQIELTEATRQQNKLLTVVGKVVAMGEQAYKKATLQDANNPVVGSWVLFATHGGHKIELADGREYRIMNDDAVIAVVDDPEPYRRGIV